MEFHVLGPIHAIEDGRRLAVAPGRQLSLLAFLLIHANRIVSAERIIDELWGDEPPENGPKTVAFHVSRLRDALEPGRERGRPSGAIATEPAGYVLRVEPEQIDAVRFERLAAQGRACLADDPETAHALLVEALGLCHGEPYADLVDASFAQPEIRRLEELRLRSMEDRLEADLALGHHADAISELEALVAQEPLRERLRGLLMLALCRAGRQAEALRAYGEGRLVLAQELGIDPGPELQQLEGWILRQDPRLEAPAARRSVRNPYKGLRPFAEEDNRDYYGREALVARLVERIGDVARAGRFLAIVGPSGSGKSSVVRAGLIPALRAGALNGSQRWPIAVMQPGTRPFRELTAALHAAGVPVEPGLAGRPALDADLATAIAGLGAGDAPVVLVIDQAEELWSIADDEEREEFVGALVRALGAHDSRLLVIVTLRADFFDRPLLFPGLGELLRTGTEVVTPLARDELERAIVRPAESVGVQLEPGLATEVIADVARQPGELPLLQYALTELFDHGDGHRLTRDGYTAVGGVLGALGRRADEVYGALDSRGREIARQAFLRLVTQGGSGEPMARRVPRAELHALGDERRQVDEVVDAFGRRRLLSFDRDAVTGEPTVQVAHEALLARWARLAGWIEEARDDLWTRRRLADAADDWNRAERDPGFLLAGSRLELFTTWAAATDLRLDGPEREFLDASLVERGRADKASAARAARERALERRATAGLRAVVAVLAVAAILATSLAIVVYAQGESAREQQAVATARELAAGSIGNLGTDPQLSLLLALASADATSERGFVAEEAMDALHWALQAAHVAFPADPTSVAVRVGPNGAHGVNLLAPDRLMALAAAATGRALTPEECRTYLHREECPAPSLSPGRPVSSVYTTAGVVPVERLASGSLAGSGVDAVLDLPADMGPLVAAFEARTGIDVIQSGGPDAELEARVAAGDLPDMAIVARPALVAELARADLLVDLSGLVDVSRLRAMAGDYLVGVGTLGSGERWPSADGRLYGAPFALEVGSLIWYPKSAMQRAGYQVPRSWDELVALEQAMVADGRTPWCLGISDSSAGGVAFVEEIVLHVAGPEVYERWAAVGRFSDPAVQRAFVELGERAFPDGHVSGGLGSALRTPRNLAAWPMFVDPPGCWLHLAGGTERSSWPAGGSGALAAFPFPADDPVSSDQLRGRAFTIVVFHDRPEVREFVDGLLGNAHADAVATALEPAGLWPVQSAGSAAESDGGNVYEGEMLAHAMRDGRFHVAASDLLPAPIATAFGQGTVQYLRWGPPSLGPVLQAIEESRRQTR